MEKKLPVEKQTQSKKVVDVLTGKWVTVMCHSQMASVARTLRVKMGVNKNASIRSCFFQKERKEVVVSNIFEFFTLKKKGKMNPILASIFFRWVGSTNTPSSGVLGESKSSSIEWLEPEKDSGWFSYLDVPGRKLGSMVNGSVGDVTPIYSIYK